MTGSRRSATPPSTLASRCRAPASKPASAGPTWTRDVSFAADLALAQLEPERTRNALRFKLSAARDGRTPGLFVAQDTGSGGSWPISSDRVVWFFAARGLLDDKPFAEEVWQALQATIAQDRHAVFDAQIGLYRGETSFLDWREQTYPDWTREDVRFIAESFALSTNVLHYQALRLAEQLARQHGDARAAQYAQWADALRQAIDGRFWDARSSQYVSYLGSAAHPVRYAKVDLLGLSLGVLADVFPPQRARLALRNYPMVAGGSPVVWPQEAAQPIYHNRAVWPFVSAYALRAARALDDAPRIALELQSLMRGSALAGSNMETTRCRALRCTWKRRTQWSGGELATPAVVGGGLSVCSAGGCVRPVGRWQRTAEVAAVLLPCCLARPSRSCWNRAHAVTCCSARRTIPVSCWWQDASNGRVRPRWCSWLGAMPTSRRRRDRSRCSHRRRHRRRSRNSSATRIASVFRKEQRCIWTAAHSMPARTGIFRRWRVAYAQPDPAARWSGVAA